MKLLYNIGISAYGLAIQLVAPFHAKAKLWTAGRKNWEQNLAVAMGESEDWIWMHCASLGEFEQGRPLIEAIKKSHPSQKILLSFFSPSGYEIRKNYPFVDHVCYLPIDTSRNARVFLDIVQPKLIVHVKYDLWLNFIVEAQDRNIHQILVSAILRANSKFLTSFLKHEYRKAFQAFSWIFTQDDASELLLANFAGDHRISVAGDTRFDRVAELPGKFEPVDGIEAFIDRRHCIVVGSTWPDDEVILLPVIARLRRANLCWIIAPHEIHASHIDHHISQHTSQMVKYSQLEHLTEDHDVLWIDNVGMLSRLYHYATLTYIGGGFGVGIHNTQEAAVYGNPVIFGPKYQNFQEAVDLIASGGARSVSTADELHLALVDWLDNPELLAHTRTNNAAYMSRKTGATQAILDKLRLLRYLDSAENEHPTNHN